MPGQPVPNHTRQYARELAKERVRRVFRDGGDWCLAAVQNNLSYTTARCAIVIHHKSVAVASVKMTVDAMAKLEEYLDKDCRATLTEMRDRLRSDTGISVGKSSIHRSLQGMLYSPKKLRIEKATMNNTINKDKRKEFVKWLDRHIATGDMIVYQDETNFNLYLSRTEG
ncbi:LOW QUALITY PROTEIN: Transposase [Phytophthora megakarya]|uniref:Transposase n=1 Tax=Phytophthora megakarya TaxID=4795 RepID=A0A225UDQ0_9STRA|nr:LOW QUALITY PROTEIN: Transposase [Phytophthora megakarya]